MSIKVFWARLLLPTVVICPVELARGGARGDLLMLCTLYTYYIYVYTYKNVCVSKSKGVETGNKASRC